jgi:LmbE family N-acetylglucosaminyl deacetylase
MQMDPVLAVCPHPDDELLGAGGTLVCQREAGTPVIVLACGLGRPGDQERRRRELATACARAGFDLVVADPPVAMGRDDDLAAAEAQVAVHVAGELSRHRPALVLAPSPRDAHHAHELVARATLRAVEETGAEQRLAFWGLWANLPSTTTVVALPSGVIDRVVAALDAHRGELERAPYGELVRARAAAAAILEPERALGFGVRHPGPQLAFAEALWELRYAPGEGWTEAAPRVVSGADVIASEPSWTRVGRPA